MLRSRDLMLCVPGRTLVRGFNLVIKRGERWAVLGRNGSGKSTLIHALSGIAPPAGGEIALDGVPLSQMRRRKLAQKLGVLLQIEDSAFWGSVGEYVMLGRHPHSRSLLGFSMQDEAIAARTLAELDLGQLRDRPFGTLSGGERQRARFAQVLAQEPDFFLLDEPFQHLDLRHQIEMLALIGRLAGQGKAVVMVVHDLFWVGHFDRALLLLDDCQAVAGAASELVTEESLSRLYRCPVRAVQDGGARYFVPEALGGTMYNSMTNTVL